MKKWAIRIGLVLVVFVVAITTLFLIRTHDRHPGYDLDLKISSSTPGTLQVGFAALPITPEIIDTWYDKNGDGKFKTADGDTFVDNNGNGRFDACWIAGFHNSRPANGVHDDLWARTMVIDDGKTRIAMVALDAIGFFLDDVIDVRKVVDQSTDVDYTWICSTHDHEAPDLMGLWGKSPFKNGVNKEYMTYVKNQTAKSVKLAETKMRPAILKVAQDLTGAKDLVMDSRKPIVLDDGLRLVQAKDAETDTTLGVLVSWGNHPETLWSRNLLITSDFPHYLREGIEKGIFHGEKKVIDGLGGIAVFINGAVGGLMTTNTRFPIKDPFADTSYTKPTFDKSRAQGYQLARLSLEALQNETSPVFSKAGISLRAKTVYLPIKNQIFRLAATLGVLNRGFSGWMKMRSEVVALNLGNISFLGLPGEIYPEIVQGGIESPEGQDFPIDPVEVPALRELMQGDVKFVFGLSNDEIGYIIPKSEWDNESPYLYGRKSSPYGEINSLGPETAPILHKSAVEVLTDLNQNKSAENVLK